MKMQGLSRWLFRPGGGSAPPATILIRLAVGGVFFASGLIKFLYANQGAGRFAKLGIPAPEFMASFVGVVEIAAGLLLAVGLATRLAAIPLVINMLVAIARASSHCSSAPGPSRWPRPPRSGSGRSPTRPGSTSPCSWAACSCSPWGPGPGRSTPGGLLRRGNRATETTIPAMKICSRPSPLRRMAGRTRPGGAAGIDLRLS